MKATLDRLPPHSLEAEQGVLGCLLLDPNDGLAHAVEKLTAECFYDRRHQTLFHTLVEMVDTRTPIDPITVQQQMRDHNRLEDAGGLSYLASLPDAVPSAAHLPHYVTIVREKFALRKIIQACAEITSQAFAVTADTEDFLDAAQSRVMELSQLKTEQRDLSIREFTQAALDEIERAHQAQGQPTGLRTGFPDLDRMTSGLHPGELVVLAARPPVGKTSLAMNMVEAVALEHNLPVAVFSLEMRGAALAQRILFSQGKIDGRDIASGLLTERDFPRLTHAAGRLIRSQIHIVDQSNFSILALKAKARRMFTRHGIKLIVVDYLQLLHSTSRKAENRRLEIGDISRGLKQLAMELNIPVLAISQLNREVEKDKGRKPRLSDLRESGDIEQDADTVLMLHRPGEAKCDPNSHDPYAVKLLIAKQRNGPRGEIDLTFFPRFTRFESCTRVQE